ncbi:Glutathione S-transferase U17 [Senna tora]|uniref:Glutathione S-transferase U17 n=1 Tax=Senna tora TaxID=362788 RepID=A0A834SU15_9FABA|nr:Glutathione S-transferase U17 [Senna tora]
MPSLCCISPSHLPFSQAPLPLPQSFFMVLILQRFDVESNFRSNGKWTEPATQKLEVVVCHLSINYQKPN